jgi:hypothetical protein
MTPNNQQPTTQERDRVRGGLNKRGGESSFQVPAQGGARDERRPAIDVNPDGSILHGRFCD